MSYEAKWNNTTVVSGDVADVPTYPRELVNSETFKTGVLNLSYAPASG